MCLLDDKLSKAGEEGKKLLKQVFKENKGFRKNIYHPSKLHPVKYIQSHAL